MRELNARQLKVVEQIAINAGAVVLGTMILGWAIAPGTFNWLSILAGATIYLCLGWLAIWVNRERGGNKQR